jgi:hypothetical protein
MMWVDETLSWCRTSDRCQPAPSMCGRYTATSLLLTLLERQYPRNQQLQGKALRMNRTRRADEVMMRGAIVLLVYKHLMSDASFDAVKHQDQVKVGFLPSCTHRSTQELI